MFSRLFDRAAPLWRAAETLGDIIVVNVLLGLSAIPIVTFGAGLTAAYDTARRLQDDDSGAARLFWTSFRTNFKQATALWLIVGLVGAAILSTWLFVRAEELVVLKLLLTIVYALVFPYVWVLQARFENSVAGTLRNAAIIAIGRLPYTAGVALIQVVVAAVIVATWIYLPQAVAFLLLLGYALVIFAASPLLERAISPLLPAEADSVA